jgi:AcrR family transcriptional regulator
MTPTYRVVTHGLDQGADADAAAQRVAALFKRPPTEIEPLLAPAACVVKKGLSADDAARYQNALTQCGLRATVESEQPAGHDPALQPGADALLADPADALALVKPLLFALLAFALAGWAGMIVSELAFDFVFFMACFAVLIFGVIGMLNAGAVYHWLRRHRA